MQQQQAEQEKKRAEKLKRQLTAMVTAAGGDPRNTDPRVVALQGALTATSGVLSRHTPADEQARRRRTAFGGSDDCTRERARRRRC